MDLIPIARSIAVLALILLAVSGILFLAAKIGILPGKLPGDILITRGNFTCAIPLISSLLLSIVLTILINLVLALIKK